MGGEGGGVGAAGPGAGAEQAHAGAGAVGAVVRGATGRVQIVRNAHLLSLPHSDGCTATDSIKPPDLRRKPR
ncbi:hypothetical protein Slala02_70710 [Streptomyces lavendulae subsp. lavendulae]|nr:hypothetical protein Slala01_70960 [Streptomyces lavendulae subsp. lavendulae]GLX31252.1 hypothetical protein Slala02_70710 [Streptomyces lavendulae subsp. lavendulae]